jgi:DNA polymerase III alpha subunit
VHAQTATQNPDDGGAQRILESLRLGGFDSSHPRLIRFLQLCGAIQDLPRHLGQHSGGMVICQGSLDKVVPLENASMPGRVVVQWDKDDCADLGIIKVDLLGLGMMAALQDALTLVNGTDRLHLIEAEPDSQGDTEDTEKTITKENAGTRREHINCEIENYERPMA